MKMIKKFFSKAKYLQITFGSRIIILKNCSVLLICSNSQNLFSNLSNDQILFFDDQDLKII